MAPRLKHNSGLFCLDSKLLSILGAILYGSFLQAFTEVVLSHSYGEGNACADKLAKQALLEHSRLLFHDQLPPYYGNCSIQQLIVTIGDSETRTQPLFPSSFVLFPTLFALSNIATYLASCVSEILNIASPSTRLLLFFYLFPHRLISSLSIFFDQYRRLRWKVLDFAELKRTSISFFDIERTETALSRWSRARKRAAKVGKGLSKDEKARKLALQHWLEAIDPRHRYGHNLQFYYVKWLHCDSNQPFFYWLDIGEGKEVSHERCSRSKLQQQCIKYLGPVEREAYEVLIEYGRLFYKQSGKCVETTRDAKWIFVLSTSKTLYVGEKNKGTFQHSSFLAGGATLSAGRLVVDDGVLKAVWPHSGHYLPTEENFQEFMSFLKGHNVDLTDVKKSPSEDEDEDITRKNKDLLFLDTPSEAELPQNLKTETHYNNAESNHHHQGPSSRLSRRVGSKIARLEIPKRGDVCAIFREEEADDSPTCNFHTPNSFSDDTTGYETAEESFIDEQEFMVVKSNLRNEGEDENRVPKEKIMKRIDSHKGMKSYQLAYQLSSRWTTGAGPRIGCMRDYPSELQFRILEEQNLSPRSRSSRAASPRILSLSRFTQRL
ncbi:IQ domain-containing protein IQM6 [Senna tora]|uniref:IQ domain-containing protein IQM6 n=1 Tax=Senna tora TaxID=362788 RepID=A0A834SHJ2_9FABA|nr:IQ domain-containing protein IQM6 [Senna tora]